MRPVNFPDLRAACALEQPPRGGARYDAVTRTLHFEGIAPSDIAPALADLESHGYTIENVDFKRSSLQDVFLELVGR